MAISDALAKYEETLLANSSRIAAIESSLRTLTWFLPGRFHDAELTSEGLYSLLNLLGLYHDSILHRAVSTLPPPLRPIPSSHTRYTRHYTTHSKPYNLLAHTLSVVQSVELLLEMAVRRRKGAKNAEKTVIALEAIKAVLRLGLMRATKGRTGVQPPVAEREMDPALLEMNRERMVQIKRAAGAKGHVASSFSSPTTTGASSATTLPPPQSAADVLLRRAENALGNDAEAGLVAVQVPESEFWTGPRTGYVRPTLASLRKEGDAALGDASASPFNLGARSKDVGKEYLLSRVLTIEDVKRPEDLVSKAKGLKKIAEVIWILRPLIYVLALRRYGRRHTLPYLLSLALEYLAYSLRVSSTARLAHDKASGPMLPHPSESELEKQETGKRAKAFWWYLMRGPVWESWTKPQLTRIANKFDDKPLVGFVSTVIKDYTPLFDEYYYYST
ncbi:hypothetical protein JCM11251_003776 [Rhodosporidiobolus azoricus]